MAAPHFFLFVLNVLVHHRPFSYTQIFPEHYIIVSLLKIMKKLNFLSYSSYSYMAVVAIVALLSFMLCGGNACIQLTISLSVAYIAALAIYMKIFSPSRLGMVVLLIVDMLMSIGVVLNVYKFTVESGGTLADPVLVNADAFRYFDQACEIYEGRPSVYRYTMPGLPLVTASLWLIFGKSIVYPLAMNVFLTLLSIIMSGRLAQILLRGYVCGISKECVASVAMMLTASISHFTGHGMLMLKEPMIYVSVLLVAIPLAHVYRYDRTTLWNIASFVVGNIMASISRPQLFFFFAVAIIMLAAYRMRNYWRILMAMTVIAASCYFAGTIVTKYTSSTHKDTVTGKGDMAANYLNNPDKRYDKYAKMIGNYYDLSMAQRLARLPISAAVQYVVPFPWNYGRDTKFGYSQAYNHFAYPWFLVGGFVLYYFIFLWLRRGSPLKLWATWVLICWIVVAYMFAGSVSRYVMPFIPLVMPLAVYVTVQLREAKMRKMFGLWFGSYAALMTIGLIICYQLQHQ